MTDVAALQAAIREAAAALGDFNVLVNNVASDDRHAIADVTPEYWDARMAVNERPAFFAIQAVLPGMTRLGGGSIVNFGSTGWQAKSGGYPAYATAKSSVMGLTRGLAKELGAKRIRINVVSPGWVMTERQLRLWAVPNMDQEIARMQCLPDPIQPADIASMVLFLASDDRARARHRTSHGVGPRACLIAWRVAARPCKDEAPPVQRQACPQPRLRGTRRDRGHE